MRMYVCGTLDGDGEPSIVAFSESINKLKQLLNKITGPKFKGWIIETGSTYCTDNKYKFIEEYVKHD